MRPAAAPPAAQDPDTLIGASAVGGAQGGGGTETLTPPGMAHHRRCHGGVHPHTWATGSPLAELDFRGQERLFHGAKGVWSFAVSGGWGGGGG